MEKSKIFVTDSTLKALEKRLHEVVGKSDLSKLRKIADKRGIVLQGGRLANLNTWYQKIVADLKGLPENNSFRRQLEGRSQWFNAPNDPALIQEYIRELGAWPEYEFLSATRWQDMELFLYSWPMAVDLPGMTLNDYISSDGDVFGHYNSFRRSNADPAAVKFSEDLHTLITKSLQKLTPEQRLNLGYAVGVLVSHSDQHEGEEMPVDAFNNMIFRTL